MRSGTNEYRLRTATSNLLALPRLLAAKSPVGGRVAIVLVVGLIAEAIWLYAVPFSWGWDTTAYLAVGRMYAGLPYSMWAIKDYYGPGYPIFLNLMGVQYFDTLAILRVGTWLVGGVMPLLLYHTVRPFHEKAALFASLIFAVSFGGAVFSSAMMNHHFHVFTLLIMSVYFTRQSFYPSMANATLFAVTAVLSNSVRQVSVYIFLAGVVILALAAWQARRDLKAIAQSTAIMVGIFVVATGVLSLTRATLLDDEFRFSLTRDYGSRVMFQGAYYGVSIYQKEFHPNEEFALMQPGNGPASEELFSGMREYFGKVADVGRNLSETNNKDEAFATLLSKPSVANSYMIWWGSENMFGLDKADRLMGRAVLEMIIAEPRALRYYAWNLWTALFGPPMMPDLYCTDCRCPPCFSPDLPRFVIGGFMGAEIFSKNAGSGLIREMEQEHNRRMSTRTWGEFVFAVARPTFDFKPFLTILAFSALFVARGPARYLVLFCAATILVITGTTSLAWPVQARYWYGALPFILAGAAMAITEIIRRARVLGAREGLG